MDPSRVASLGAKKHWRWAGLDFGASDAPPPAFIALALARVAALLALHHPRWRQRGGWVLALTGGTLIACVWEVCAGVLSRDGQRREVEGLFLIVTASFAISEFLLFLLLLRLSPIRTYTLRPPPGRTPSLPLTPHVTPLPTQRRGARDRPPLAPLFTTPIPSPPRAADAVSPIEGMGQSYGAMSIATSITSFGPATVRSPRWDGGELRSPAPWETDEEGYRTNADYYDVEAGETGYETDGSDSTSTVSDSSIIDLPPPRPLHPVTLDSGLAELAGAVEAAAGVVRRSASARFGRSIETSEGYGTFSR
ncbi:hypothetical protein CC85DRAFT_327688 [Cutaneotrichosporon oleaginosum]|uniref:Uncharacterized protein n=1 Tax=Cutaneotrichosporon oleaginosum TaxID=879819 RepID=A0A0J1B5L9_9TREE|nr:uncharacterized protein CC85DRAFT_327688 [Cutaneotrichosporon oleaginosum]KLT42984.1 hypothetical protein CC85DRAFT_327688 [Cutaneotrichosporon oleaginosum]TXT11807.1 hypothetical protein COLE_02217 [Cutaneotrichosporon oleaginosum]